MNPFSASVHAVIGPVGGSPNPIGCADVFYMLRGSSLTLSYLLVAILTLPDWCHVGTLSYASNAQICFVCRRRMALRGSENCFSLPVL